MHDTGFMVLMLELCGGIIFGRLVLSGLWLGHTLGGVEASGSRKEDNLFSVE